MIGSMNMLIDETGDDEVLVIQFEQAFFSARKRRDFFILDRKSDFTIPWFSK